MLLYASDSSSARHVTARHWIERALSATEAIGLAMVSLLGFVRIVTNPRLMSEPLTPSAAFDQIDEWLAQPPATIIHPGRRHLAICRQLLEASGPAGNLT